MNQQQKKIRFGLILQGVLAHSLRRAGIDFIETPQYAEGYEKPDFLIPDDEDPRIMVEVHQTEARDHFRMKTLRCITAVTEAKIHFGDEMIAVNILFGNPHIEVPAANLRAMCGLFDHNILLIDHLSYDELCAVQETAFQLAGTDGVTTSNAADQVVREHKAIVGVIAQVMSSQMGMASTNPRLLPLWQMERARQNSLTDPPLAGSPTYYKRNILRSLFFTDGQFQELLPTNNPEDLSQQVQEQLLRCNLATLTEEMWGDTLEIDLSFFEFLEDSECLRLRALCKDRISEDEAMKWFFEDIRNAPRRIRMAELYLEQVCDANLVEALIGNMVDGDYAGIQHGRTWLVDLLTRDLDISLNILSRRLYTQHRNPGSFGDPISHIAPRTDRFTNLTLKDKRTWAEEICNACFLIAEEKSYTIGHTSSSELADRLLKLRLNGAIKLQKLNPLYLVLEAACKALRLSADYMGTRSLITDLSNSNQSLGKYKVYHISNGSQRLIANALAPNENPGDKAKEWGARCQAMLYRDLGNGVIRSDVDAALMILDGIWENDDVARLYRAGWTHVARLDQVEEILREIFSIPSDKLIEIPEEELPLAAEDDGSSGLDIL